MVDIGENFLILICLDVNHTGLIGVKQSRSYLFIFSTAPERSLFDDYLVSPL